MDDMALPPCHTFWQLNYAGKSDDKIKMDIHLYMRSSDTVLGLPMNALYYAMMLKIILKIASSDKYKYIPNKLIISFGDVHIYNNHIDKLRDIEIFSCACEPLIDTLLDYEPFEITFPDIKSIDDFSYKDCVIKERHTVFGKLDFPVSV